MSKSTFDPSLPVRTRDGRPARIVVTDRKGTTPILALIDEGGFETPRDYDARGLVKDSRIQRHPADLVNVPATAIRYLNVYPDGVACSQPDAETAYFQLAKGGRTLEVSVEGDTVVGVRLI